MIRGCYALLFLTKISRTIPRFLTVIMIKPSSTPVGMLVCTIHYITTSTAQDVEMRIAEILKEILSKSVSDMLVD